MNPTIFISLLFALGATNTLAVHHAPQRRAIGGHYMHPRAPAPKPGRHDYLLNSTLTNKITTRDQKGQATFYHPASEGGAQSSCGEWMNDNTMGVALSIPGWDHFRSQGIDAKELCYKSITIHGILGDQKAKIMDECPTDGSTKTCTSICDVDLTYGLFGMLAKHDLGIFPVSWSFDDGTPSPCGNGASSSSSSSSSSSHSKSSSSSSSSHSPSATSTSSKSVESKAAHAKSSTSVASSATASASGDAEATYSTALQWWDEIDSQWCPNVNTPEGTITVAVGPSAKYPNAKLQDVCGKWITIKSDDKTIKAQVVEWIPNTTENFLAVGTAYQSIVASGSGQVKWGFNE